MENLLSDIEKHISSFLNDELSSDLVYHNLSHTQRVVASVSEISEAEKVSDSDKKALLIAAWFHDTGYAKSLDNHEEFSVKITKEYLSELEVKEVEILKVSHLILTTKMDVEPQNRLEKFLRDADASHFPLKQYYQISELLRKEWELTKNQRYSEKEWIELNISFFTQHHRFYTNYAIENWQDGKDKNLAFLFKSLEKFNKHSKM